MLCDSPNSLRFSLAILGATATTSSTQTGAIASLPGNSEKHLLCQHVSKTSCTQAHARQHCLPQGIKRPSGRKRLKSQSESGRKATNLNDFRQELFEGEGELLFPYFVTVIAVDFSSVIVKQT